MVGAPSEVSVNDPEILNLVEATLTQLDAESTLNEKFKTTEIVSATRQLVAGVLYNITVKIVPSDCPKTDPKAREQCGVAKEHEPQLCDIRIWSRPWLPNGKETNVTCSAVTYNFRSKRSLRSSFGQNDLDVELGLFRRFKQKFDKRYHSNTEERRRFKIFYKNLFRIRELNSKEQGSAVYGITKFSDMTYDEFRAKYLGLRRELHNENEILFPQANIPDIELPDSFDWREKNVVTEVKDQKSCGSCWAFSVTGNVEGQYALKHNELLEFSEQELVDCDKYDEGCGGGLMDNAYRSA